MDWTMFDYISNIVSGTLYYMLWVWLIVIAAVVIWAVVMHIREAVEIEVSEQNNSKLTDRDEDV